MTNYKYIIFLLSVVVCFSCTNWWGREDKLIAQVNGYKLYSSDLEKYIPKNISKEDSVNFALQYINTWASDLIFLNIAEKNLSKQEQDVTNELEEYRRALLKYRYEKRYINERLDTVIDKKDIEEYYKQHKKDFVLKNTVVRAVYFNIDKNNPKYKDLKDLFLSDNMDDAQVADSIALKETFVYKNYANTWVEIDKLLEEFNISERYFLSLLRNKQVRTYNEATSSIKVAFVFDVEKAGAYAPVDFVEKEIKDIVLSYRRRSLLNNLEIDILQTEKDKNNFIIY